MRKKSRYGASIASSHVMARLISWYHFDCIGANMGIRFEFTYQYVELYYVLGHPYVTTNQLHNVPIAGCMSVV